MTYATEDVASTLKNARNAKGLTQRGLGKIAAVPQSHISKIENGAVDLRVSSLVELARVLDLELMLVPRKMVSAVQSIIGGDIASTPPENQSAAQALQELTQLQDALAGLVRANPSDVELAQLAGQVRQLQHYRMPARYLDTIRSVRKGVQAFRGHSRSPGAVRDWLSQLARLRNSLVHDLAGRGQAASSRPAYNLDEDDDGC